MRPSKDAQINRALALLDRIIALIEDEDDLLPNDTSKEPLLSADVRSRVHYRSRYWKDTQVREAMLALYGRASARDAAAILAAEFGPDRAPGKSALGRIFARIADEQAKKQ